MSAQTAPKRYSPLWVTLHWLTVLLVFAAFYLGISSFDSPLDAKAQFLRIHMPLGITIFVLTIIRLFVRWRTPAPAPASIGNAWLDKIGEWTHYLLYAFVLIVPLSGIFLTVRFNLVPAVFEGGALPVDLNPLLHGVINPLFMLFILLHIGAALYHQFIRRDNLLARMGYEKK